MRKSFAIVFIFLCQSLHLFSYQYDLAMCAIFNNEARFMKEWIEFHKLVGVQHFYLYNHLSTDNFENVLAPYLANGEVELYNWSQDYSDLGEWNTIQCNAYQDAIERTRKKVKWLALIDLDEFIVPTKDSNLVNLLKKYDRYSGVGINWLMFGTSHVTSIQSDQLMTGVLQMRAPTDFPLHATIKCIVKPSKVDKCVNPHWVYFKKGYHVNANGQRCQEHFSPSICVDKVRIHHYWSKDEEFLYDVKFARAKKAFPGLTYEEFCQSCERYNQVEDTTMDRFQDQLKENVKF